MSYLLLTGHLGFIGSNFAIRAINSGKKLIGLDKLTYAGNLKNVAEIENNPNYIFIKGDINNKELVNDIFNKYKISAVVNFAAESHVDNSISSPKEFITSNINGVFTLLEEARAYYNKSKDENFRFLHISTDEVYGSLGEKGKFSEKSNYQPNSPYSASKAASDHLVRAWFETYGLPTLTTNCSNNFGPKQHSEKLIPTIIRSCLNNKPIPIYGDGKNIRDWIFVEDHCEGIELVLKKGKVGETYCLGTNNERTNLQIVNSICEILDRLKPEEKSYKNLISFVKDRAGHDRRYAIDNTKAVKELGFNPKGSFEENLEKTIRWYLTKS
ncbi:MAG: dTDP-glucose 4,6-dehydratase [Alphaproteobacteria bacterium]|jgi:dTDP-glucose 4,6-dehydratase